MKFTEALFVIFCVLVLIFVIYLASHSSPVNGPASATSTAIIGTNRNNSMALSLSSSAFSNNGEIPAKFTCDGENINPPLTIEGADPKAKSLALILDDPDAQSVVGYTYIHWVKFNIDPKTINIDEGKEPLGTPGKGSGNNLTYDGPCPPNGTHHYHFQLYSLDSELALPEGATATEVMAAMQGHILQQTELVGLYSRTK